MMVGTAVIKLYAPWVHSLKEKRMEVKKLIERAKNKFNISIAEVEEMDLHQSIVIGIACVANNNKQVNSILNEAINFIETNTEAELVDISVEIY